MRNLRRSVISIGSEEKGTGDGGRHTFIVIVPTCRRSVSTESEFTFVDAVDLADDAVGGSVVGKC